MGLTDEQKKEISKKSFEAMMEMAVGLAILNLDGELSVENKTDYESVETLIYGLMAEDERFKTAFMSSGIRIIQMTAEIQLLKPFQWDAKERLESKRYRLTSEFGQYLGNKLTHYIKFPDKKVRDKILSALGGA